MNARIQREDRPEYEVVQLREIEVLWYLLILRARRIGERKLQFTSRSGRSQDDFSDTSGDNWGILSTFCQAPQHACDLACSFIAQFLSLHKKDCSKF